MSALVASSIADFRPIGFASKMVTDTAVIPGDENIGAEPLKAANVGDNQDWATRGHQNVFDELPACRWWRVGRVDLAEND